MKTIFIVTTLVLLFCPWSKAETTEISEVTTENSSVITEIYSVSTEISPVTPQKLTVYDITARRIIDVWDMLVGNKNPPSEGFVGRCFGMAKKLRMLMPIIIFKLGVIMTVLGFLTLFSLKSLALLVALLVINVGGITSKLALFKHGEEHHSPSNVHFHIHPSKEGFHHSGPESWPWDRVYSPHASAEMSEKYNLYNKLIGSPFRGTNSVYDYR